MRVNFYFNLYLLVYLTRLIYSFDFEQNFFGVCFRPYVKNKEGNTTPSRESYSRENVKAMLTVVSKKFGKIFVRDGKYAINDSYNGNATYDNGSYASLYSGEIAASINKENGNKSLTVLYQIDMVKNDSGVDTEILLVLEAARRANHIYPGTVEGVLFAETFTLGQIRLILNYLQTYKSKSKELGLKFGAELLNCYDFIKRYNTTLVNVQEDLVAKSDFITCGILNPTYKDFGPKDAFQSVGKDMTSFKNLFENINPNVSFIGNLQWFSSGPKKWQTIENLRIYWETASKFASEEKFTIYLEEAFENPNRTNPHNGWWTLKDNSQINSSGGYAEKITERENAKTTSTWSTTTIAAVIIGGILVTLIFFSYFGSIFYRVAQSTVLSFKEIQVFQFGSVKTSSTSHETELETALNAPYNKSLEIRKDKLKIDRGSLLGRGEFGYVCKGVILGTGDEVNDVAIKVAKQTCSSTLKGLLSEIKIMSYLGKHENIVALVGVYTAELAYGKVYVVTELCSLGSLETYLRKCPLTAMNLKSQEAKQNDEARGTVYENTSLTVSFSDMLQWSHQIACGMEYLESKHVVHADLATRNVLLNSEKVAKVSDFGLSRRMYNYMNYVKTHQEPLPWRWMSIESLKRMEFSSKSDVWSFGITLWEIYSKGDIPYQGLSWIHEFSNNLQDGLRPHRPLLALPEVYKLMQDCWASEPDQRPSFSDLVSSTGDMLVKFGHVTCNGSDVEMPMYANLTNLKSLE